jgi:beta-barrel assembly-enhancing protease
MPSRRRPLRHRLLAAVLAAAIALPVPAQNANVRLPALGESASDDLSVANEKRIGDQIMREGRRDPTYLDDPVLLDYVLSIWSRLVSTARDRGDIDADTDRSFAWEAFLLSERSVNAFALPGGYVGVHLGLIAITTSRDQFASVLAHELAHVTQRHIARSIAPSTRASMVGLAAILLGILAASRGAGPDVANAAITGGQAAAIQGQLNFSREVEREADRLGFGVLAGAGYEIRGMSEMFERMEAAQRFNDNNNFPYLRTHPLTVDRVAEARSRTLVPAAMGPRLPPAPVLHALMQMRARVLMDTSVQGLTRLVGGATASSAPADRLAAVYGGVLAAVRLKDNARLQALAPALDEALRSAAALPAREPTAERVLHLAKAEQLLALGQAEQAARWLAQLPPLPGMDSLWTRPTLLMRAAATAEWQRLAPPGAIGAATELRAVTEDLQTWLAGQPTDAAAWELMARTADGAGLKLRSMRAAAEARAAVGDLNGAIDRLRAAQGQARSVSGQDFIEASVIDARLRRLVAERRQLALDARGGRAQAPEPDAPR